MSDYSVLASEPRYRVDDVVDEISTRMRAVVGDMSHEFETLVRRMIDSFTAFKLAHYLVTLDDVRFVETRWQESDGKLLLTFGLGDKPLDPEMPRYKVVDDFVTDVTGRTVPQEFREECSDFLRAMVMQFAAIRKHSLLDLRQITFGTPEWISDRQLTIPMLYERRPFTPQVARW